MSEELTAQQQLTLNQVRSMLDTKEQTRDALDNKAATILQSSSLVITLTGALGISALVTNQASPWVLGAIIFAFCMFLAMLLCALWAWRPSDHSLPGTSDWDKLYNEYINEDLNRCYAQILSDLLESIKKNNEYNERKYRYVLWAGRLFAIQVAGILIGAGVAAYLQR